MKHRHGFVSNSSSSSFIIEKSDKYPDAYSLAHDMIFYREWESDEELASKIRIATRKRKLSKLNNEEVKFKTPHVNFKSCNYDTYIVDFDNYLLVETCNNHDWNDFYHLEVIPSYEFKEKFETEIKNRGYEDDFYWDELVGLDIIFDFYSLEYDKVGKRSKNFSYCSKCYQEYWNIDGVDQCLCCGKKEN